MSETITREIHEEFTPKTLAAFIAELIRTDPRWWNQGSWFGGAFDDRPDVAAVRDLLRRNEWTCGSTGCVAGWAAVLTAPQGATVFGYREALYTASGDYLGAVMTLGREALGIGAAQAEYLFHGRRGQEEVLTALDAIAETGTFQIPADADDHKCPCGCDDEDDGE
jgi:hypothetical protein